MIKKGLIITLALAVVSFIAYVVFFAVRVNNNMDEAFLLTETTKQKLDRSRNERDGKLLDVIIGTGAGIEFSFPYLYKDFVSEIPDDKDEKSIIVQKLKAKGFVVNSWGRGNFMEGPRIVGYTLRKDFCECEVTKAYYSTEVDTLFDVREKIKCRKLN